MDYTNPYLAHQFRAQHSLQQPQISYYANNFYCPQNSFEDEHQSRILHQQQPAIKMKNNQIHTIETIIPPLKRKIIEDQQISHSNKSMKKNHSINFNESHAKTIDHKKNCSNYISEKLAKKKKKRGINSDPIQDINFNGESSISNKLQQQNYGQIHQSHFEHNHQPNLEQNNQSHFEHTRQPNFEYIRFEPNFEHNLPSSFPYNGQTNFEQNNKVNFEQNHESFLQKDMIRATEFLGHLTVRLNANQLKQFLKLISIVRSYHLRGTYHKQEINEEVLKLSSELFSGDNFLLNEFQFFYAGFILWANSTIQPTTQSLQPINYNMDQTFNQPILQNGMDQINNRLMKNIYPITTPQMIPSFTYSNQSDYNHFIHKNNFFPREFTPLQMHENIFHTEQLLSSSSPPPQPPLPAHFIFNQQW